MKKSKKVLPIMLATALATTPFMVAPQAYAISSLKVTPDDDLVSEQTSYDIEFILDKALDEGDEISIIFESDFDLDEVDEDDVSIEFADSGYSIDYDVIEVDPDKNEIVITLDEELEIDDEILITVDNVINPDEEDDYSVKVDTTTESSKTYYVSIYEDDDSSDDEFDVKIGDDEEGAETSYTLGTIELEDDLVKNKWVYVTFPDKNMLPSSMDTDDVEINGYEVADVDVYGATVELKIPAKADGDDELEIEFFESAGITNPDADDDYVIKVKYNNVTYESEEFEITESSGTSSSDYAVYLSDSAAGARSSYTFEADFGSKKLKADAEVIVEFPNSEMIPGFLDKADITINGDTPKSVYTSGSKVYLKAPSDFKSASKVKVNFAYDAWITNPKSAGSYTLKMTVDGKTITSKSFTINGSVATPVPATPTTVDNSTATITLTNTALNAPTGVNVAIKGVGVPLAKQRDFIELVFPVGYRVPAYIAPANVTVNGMMSNYVAVRGQNVLIYPTQDILAGTAVNVVINPAANIINPAVKNAYSISVYTSEEKGLLFARAVSVGGAVVTTPATPAQQPAVTVPANAALFKVNVASFTLKNKAYPLQAAPYLANNSTTMVPAQFFKEALALTTLWNNYTVSISSGTKVIKFTVGSNKAKVGSQDVTLPAPVQLKNGMPMVPIRFVADTLGYKVGWDGKTQSVFIYR